MSEQLAIVPVAEDNSLPLGRYYIENGKSYYRFVRGQTVEIEQVSPTLTLEIQQKMQEPMPPVKTFDRGDGVMITEVNKADPQYNHDLVQWQLNIEAAYAQLIIKLGVKSDPDLVAVKKVRDLMSTLYQIELDPDDNFVYVKYCLPSNEQEYNHFLACAVGRSRPDQGAIAKAIEQFSGNIQEKAPVLRALNGAG